MSVGKPCLKFALLHGSENWQMTSNTLESFKERWAGESLDHSLSLSLLLHDCNAMALCYRAHSLDELTEISAYKCSTLPGA